MTSLALCAIACDGPSVPSPSAPSQTTPNQPAATVDTGQQHLVFSDRYTSVALGQVVRSQVTADDVACGWGYYCKYFQLSVLRDGTLEKG